MDLVQVFIFTSRALDTRGTEDALIVPIFAIMLMVPSKAEVPPTTKAISSRLTNASNSSLLAYCIRSSKWNAMPAANTSPKTVNTASMINNDMLRNPDGEFAPGSRF